MRAYAAQGGRPPVVSDTSAKLSLAEMVCVLLGAKPFARNPSSSADTVTVTSATVSDETLTAALNVLPGPEVTICWITTSPEPLR
jgi:hypothetical protein